MGAVAGSPASSQGRTDGVLAPHSEQAALRWQIDREGRRRRNWTWALAATPLIAIGAYVLTGIPAYLLAPYPTDTDAHTAFVRTVMLLAAFLCAAVYVGVCVSGRIRAGRRQDKGRMRLFLLGGNAAFATTSTAPAARTRDTVTGQPRAFVVHGRDEAALHEVARFVDRLGIEPVVLRELPSGGRTIIEKFEDLSEVDCAVVLLTPDDRGGLATDSFELQRPRARQNVLRRRRHEYCMRTGPVRPMNSCDTKVANATLMIFG